MMMMPSSLTAAAAAAALLLPSVAQAANSSACPDYTTYSEQIHLPLSSGRYQLSSMRPSPDCRTYVVPAVDQAIARMNTTIKDPDLYRLFSNSFPNTLDTTVKWTGYAANNSKEELAFVITGDIDAMWLRDSANQLQSYVSFLKPNASKDSLASLYRGVINLQGRYLQTAPYCQSFQPPPESGLPPSVNGAANGDMVTPPYSDKQVFECKFELDTLAAFLEVSNNYWMQTHDAAFFKAFQWPAAVQTALNVARSMMVSTYAQDGNVTTSPYTFIRTTTTSEDTLDNSGVGNPTQSGVGLIRSTFRPSDDACIFQYFVPANAMFSRLLQSTAAIADAIGQKDLAADMTALGGQLRSAIYAQGLTHDAKYGTIFAYEFDGFGSINSMDDANIPSLLALPFLNFTDVNDPVYVATRKKILSADDPYFARGPVINAVGGPHDGPGHAWPMASIVRILTSSDDDEIYTALKELVSSTAGLGLIHESINSFNETNWTRQWFAWANGLFGQMVLDLAQRKPALLARSYQ